MIDSTQEKTEKHSLVVMIVTLASRLLGIIKAKVIGSVFGSGLEGDVINFTYNIPNNFRKLFAEGAMSSAYVPMFSTQLAEGSEHDSHQLMDLLFTMQLSLFGILVALSVFFGDDVISAFSDFGREGVKLGGALLPFFMVFLATISIATVCAGILQCQHRFFLSSFPSLVFSATVIIGILLLNKRYGAMSMAYSVMIGGFLQFICLYLPLRKSGYRLRLRFDFRQCGFPKVMKNWVVVMNASLIQIAAQQFSFYLASTMPEGSVTAFSNALIFWQTPYGIFFTAISTVYFPLMSASWKEGQYERLKEEVGLGLQYLATFLIPSAIIIFALANECVSSILQSGGFLLETAMQTANVVRWYLVGMLFVAWYGFLQRLAYSIGRYRMVFWLTIGQSVLDVVLSFLLIGKLGVIALPIANSLTYLISFLVLLYLVKDVYRMGKKELKAMLKVILCNAPLLFLAIVYKSMGITFWMSGSTVRNFLITCILGIIAIAVVFLCYVLMKIPFLAVFGRKKK